MAPKKQQVKDATKELGGGEMKLLISNDWTDKLLKTSTRWNASDII